METSHIQFRDLQRQYKRIKSEIDTNIAEVISSADFISGSKVRQLEQTLASYVGVKHCISCANGTDAIYIALKAHDVGVGDAVFVPDFTFFSSGESPAVAGAVPVFVDVEKDTYNMDPESLEKAVESVEEEGQLKPRAVVAVDLFGQPFDVPVIRHICEKHGMLLLEDAAQGFGGSYTTRHDDGVSERKMACSLGDIGTTSFFPAKPFGCYGDGGAIFTNDDAIARKCRSIAIHGKDMENPDDPNSKYNNIRLGMNSRLDTLQAGVLLAKFDTFKGFELGAVNDVADMYCDRLSGIEGLALPKVRVECFSSWAQYTIRLPMAYGRSEVQYRLKSAGIPTNIYYIRPMHKQEAFANTRSCMAECPVAEELCDTVLCLPIHPYMEEREVDYIAAELEKVMGKEK